jgi:hypothetical protein
MKALSVRQPWAWLIANGHKTVENRSRNIGRHLGRLYIHASKIMTQADYEACVLFLRSSVELAHLVDVLPKPAELDRGGLVGTVRVWGLDNANELIRDPWYTGEFAYLLNDAVPLEIFAPCAGRLGFFEIEVV